MHAVGVRKGRYTCVSASLSAAFRTVGFSDGTQPSPSLVAALGLHGWGSTRLRVLFFFIALVASAAVVFTSLG